MAAAVLALAISGLAAGKTAKKYGSFTQLYYFTGSSYFSFPPGCLSTLLTLTNSGSLHQAVIKGVSNTSFEIFYYYPSLGFYVPVYSTVF